VSKGLDFENVTLVGIVTADTTLNLPDFTAGEKTYQLLTQVSGRAGRGSKAGEVVIQTYSPTDPAIVHSKDLMYDEFMLGELDLRYAMKYPPYQKLIIINFFSNDEMLSKNSAQKFISAFRKSSAFSHDIDVHGPCMGANARIRGKFRYQVIIKYRKNMDDTDLKKFIRDITIVSRNKNFDSKVMITSDIDAKTLL
jgi:primosomal protein N' (replication factor Y) (superfamily II helicase)